MKKIISVLVSILSINLFLFSQDLSQEIKIKSPVEGNWSNKQMLIIDEYDKNLDYYFSLNGSDPEISGFAYDGPVLLDLTGKISLRIKRSDGVEKYINFSVSPDYGYDGNYSDFIYEFIEKGELNYTCGNTINIPEKLCYSFTDRLTDLKKGSGISISNKNVVSKNLPCLLYDSESGKKWRFIININPAIEERNYKNNYPFKINNWKDLTFTDKNYIYRVDNKYWHGFDTSEILDRSVEHTIYWQSIDYKEGNPIESFVLPPKPSYVAHKIPLKEHWFTIKGNPDYRFGIIDENNDTDYLYTSLGADTFPGDKIEGSMNIGFFYKTVYQGKMNQVYSIDKSIPEIPEIIPDSKDFYVKKNLILDINCKPDSSLAIAISKPFVINDDSVEITPEYFADQDIQMDNFVFLNTDTFRTELIPVNDNSTYYRIKTFAYNEIDESLVVEYSVVVGENIFYISNIDNPVKDGSKKYPFTDFSKCMDAVSMCDYSKIKIIGSVNIKEPQTINTNCDFINESDGELIFENQSFLNFIDSNVIFKDLDFTVQDDYTGNKSNPMILSQNSNLTFYNCLISANFNKNASVFEISNSSLTCSELIAAINSTEYSSFMTAINSIVNIKDSKINNSSNFASCFTFKESEIILDKNEFMVTGNRGRICDFFNSTGSVSNNSFNCDLQDLKKSGAINKDELSEIKETGNEYYGF
ncbi:MAG: hypothetical protein MJ174_00865 [Treponema sp.]|nr:hypothetical protein [Treponema sp.]